MAGLASLAVRASVLYFCLSSAPAAARFVRQDWGLAVYVTLDGPSLRSVSATTSSFIAEGSLRWSWRDDSLREYYEDGDVIDATYPSGPSALANYTNTRTGESGFEVCGATPCAGPWLRLAWRGRLASAFSVATAAVSYSPPSFYVESAPSDTAAYVVGSEDFSSTFLQVQQLAAFPFDTQTLAWSVDVATFPSSDMRFVLAPAMSSGAAVALASPPDGYSVSAAGAALSFVPSAVGNSSRLTVSYVTPRLPEFFVNRFIWPLCLLFVVTPLSVAVMPPTPGRFIPITSFAITVSFVFVAGQSVPVLPYTTRLDKFFLLCFFTSAICLFYTYAIFCRVERSKKHIAEATKRNGGRFACCACCAGGPPPPPAAADKPGAADKQQPAATVELVAISTGGAVASPPGVDVAKPPPPPPPAIAPPLKPQPRDFCGLLLADELDRSDVIFATSMIAAFAVATAVICRAPGV
jgi:hypothetical protein